MTSSSSRCGSQGWGQTAWVSAGPLHPSADRSLRVGSLSFAVCKVGSTHEWLEEAPGWDPDVCDFQVPTLQCSTI